MHGLFGSSDNWITLGRRFAEHHTVVLTELRNHGRSPKSDLWNYQAMAQDIYKLAKDLGFVNINLLGHSMGGKVGMTIASMFPELLEKLIVADIVQVITNYIEIQFPNKFSLIAAVEVFKQK